MKFSKSIPLTKVKCLAVHPTQQLLYFGMYNGTVLIYDSVNLTLLHALSLGNIVRSISVNEEFIVTGDDSGKISVFDTNYYKVNSKTIHSDFIRKVLIKDNLIYSSSDDCTIVISDLNLSRIGILEGHKHFVMDFMIVDSLLYSVSLDCSMGTFNLKSSKGNFTPLHENGINSITMFNKFIVTGSDDPSIKLISNFVTVSKIPFTSNVVKLINYEEMLLVCCENGEFSILSKELQTLFKVNLKTKLWDVKLKNNKMFLATDEGIKVYDYLKLNFGFVTDEKGFFIEGDSIFYTRFVDNAFLVKESKLPFEPESVSFSPNGKSLCILKDNTFNLLNTLGYRIKHSGECKEMSISNDLLVTLDDKGLHLLENNKVIEHFNYFPKKVKIIDEFIIGLFDSKIKVINKEGTEIKEVSFTEKPIDFTFCREIIYFNDKNLLIGQFVIEKKVSSLFIYNEIIFFISNNMLYYVIIHKNKINYIFVCNVSGFPLGINNRGLVIWDDKFKIIDIKINKIIECFDLLDGKITSSDNILLTQFLISIGEYEEALSYSSDPLIKFDILLKLNKLKECIPLCKNKMMYQKLAKKFLEIYDYQNASDLFYMAEDYDSAFLFDLNGKNIYPPLKSDLEIIRRYRSNNFKDFFKGSEFKNLVEKFY